ncbi:MAG: polysaccharide biosynthesis tyrosine autokinase [Sphingobacteriales bacterium]|nr:polysaccharide biosynthesis tyrosine autokinase [Sphingobacteriales bacterium]OJY81026.1 MAG: hypothetical protein BGP14_07300 [Sphingobacteriales bacterium 44-15]
MSDRFEAGFESKQPVKEIQLKEFIFRYLRYWPLLFSFVLIMLTLAFIKLRYATPIYNVTGSLFINKETGNKSNNTELQNIFRLSDNVNLKNELEILKSKPLLKRVVQNLGLQVGYYNKGKVRTSNIYGANPIMLDIISLKDSSMSFTIDIEASEKDFKFSNTNNVVSYGTVFQTSAGEFKISKVLNRSFSGFNSDNYIITYTPLLHAAAALASSLTTAQTIDQATILDISLETDNIQYGKDVVNELMNEYGKMNVEDKRETSQVTMQFIDERLDTIKNELGGVENGLLHFREKNEVIDLTTQSQQYYENFSEVNKQLITQQVRIGVVEYLQQYIGNPANRYKIVPTDLGIEEATLLPLLTQYNAFQLQRSTLTQTTGPSNPALASTELNITKLRDQIQEALKNVRKAYGIAADKMQQQANSLQSHIKSVPSKAKGLLDIERQQKIKQDLYLFLLQKREEAAIAAAATISSSNPLEEASSTGGPVKPNKRNVYLIALLIGVLVPVIIISVMEMLNDKIREREEIVRHTQAPVIGEIGHAGDQTLVVRAGSRSVVAEQFRIMRTNIQYFINKVANPVILVTSSVSGEGKSFVATNFGAAIALTGKKTVILEFDIRKPRLLKGLNMHSAEGLSNFMVGTVTDIEKIIQPVDGFPNLYVIGCGPVPPNPSELLLDPQVPVLFDKLKNTFDCIIIDSAPVGLVSDAFTLSNYANASLYIVRHGYTLKRQLAMINDLYMQKRLSQMGLVINDIQTQGRYKGYYGYGGGSYYGYGYGYGYGGDYFEEHKRAKSIGINLLRLRKK